MNALIIVKSITHFTKNNFDYINKGNNNHEKANI